MKKRPHHQSNESAKNQGYSTAHYEKYQKLIKNLFPEKATTCFECRTKLTNGNRKCIVTFHTVPKGAVASGHQVCKSCAVLMQAGKYHKLPKISSDIAAQRFELIGTEVECVGGVQ